MKYRETFLGWEIIDYDTVSYVVYNDYPTHKYPTVADYIYIAYNTSYYEV